MRRRKLIEAVLDGKPLRKSGLEMGLSPKTVDSQVSRIMREPQVRQAFNRIEEAAGIDDKFLADKIRQLVDARAIIHSQKDGLFSDSREIPAWEMQRKTVELCTRLLGYLKDDVSASTTTTNHGLLQFVVAQLNQPKP